MKENEVSSLQLFSFISMIKKTLKKSDTNLNLKYLCQLLLLTISYYGNNAINTVDKFY